MSNAQNIANIEDNGWVYPVYRDANGLYFIDLGGAVGISDPCSFDSDADAINFFEEQLREY